MAEMILHKSGKAAAQERLFFGFLFTYEFAFFGEFSSFAAMNGYFSFFGGRVLSFVFFLFAIGPRAGTEVEIRFNRDLWPILFDKCYRCHDSDQNARQADLRLDAEASVGMAKGLAAKMES